MGRVPVVSIFIASLLAGCAPESNSAYVSVAVPLDENCIAKPNSEVFLSAGSYDIALGGIPGSNYCQKSYYMHLVVNSQLKSNSNDAIGRAEPNVLQITDAEVRLIDVEQQGIIVFDDLPNPFRVKANNSLPPTTGREPQPGVVSVEAIPIGYDTQLRDYVGEQILAEVTIFGTTIGDVPVDFKPFEFPIRICNGCMTACESDFPGASPAEIYGDGCIDDGGQDGRLCVDPACGIEDDE